MDEFTAYVIAYIGLGVLFGLWIAEMRDSGKPSEHDLKRKWEAERGELAEKEKMP